MDAPRSLSPFFVGFGAILGACVGDAAGAPLERMEGTPTLQEVFTACNMSGGGAHRTAPGQITDDGEQTLSMIRGLIKCQGKFDVEKLAVEYVKWLNSTPFDAGMTTFETMGAAARMSLSTSPIHLDHLATNGCSGVMKNAALKFTMNSKSNGCLMRASPLGVWGFNLQDNEIAAMAFQDCSLTNPNQSCCDSVAAYSIAIASLMRQPGNNLAAFSSAEDWINKNANDEVKGWIADAKAHNLPDAKKDSGFIKIAFIFAFSHLLKKSSFSDAIQQTLLAGGDTDTNACIVGGLIGALRGREGIPDRMANAVLQCDTTRGRPRPDFLWTSELSTLIPALMESAPKKIDK